MHIEERKPVAAEWLHASVLRETIGHGPTPCEAIKAQALWHTGSKYIIHRPLICPDRSQQVYEQAVTYS